MYHILNNLKNNSSFVSKYCRRMEGNAAGTMFKYL